MTAITSSLLWLCRDNTENYNWIKAVSDALTAAGVALHTDTGQIDLSGSTVTLPVTNANYAIVSGYQIRKLVEVGLPTLYLRIEYCVRRLDNTVGVGALANVPVVSINAGSGTDGAGNLTGIVFTFNAFSSAGSYVGASSNVGFIQTWRRPFYISSDGKNYLTIMIDPALSGHGQSGKTSTNVPMAFCLERTSDASTFKYDAEGALMYVSGGDSPSNATLNQLQWFTFLGHRNSVATGAVPAQVPAAYLSSPAGDTQLFPVTVAIPMTKAPMRSMMYYYLADITDGGTVTANIFGETHTYMASGQYSYQSSYILPTAVRPALRFD